MALSNTAVPKYYAKFRNAVVSGEIPVNKEISMEMNRIDSLVRDPKYYYDESPVEGWISFCEEELTLTDGSDLHLLESFKLWAEEVYCWYYFEEQKFYEPYKNKRGGSYVTKVIKKRLTKKQYLIVGRGAAKSLYDSCHQAYSCIVDTTTTHQITTAPTMKQAEEVMSPIRTAITRARGPLLKFLTYGSLQNTTGSKANRSKLAATKKGVENFLTGSLIEIRPMAINKLQGLRVKLSTVDEWLSGDLREDPIGAIEQGASKVEDYLIIATSSEGTVRDGSGDTIKLELLKILKGEYYAPHVSIFYYKLDDQLEIRYPEMWVKANPNLGITVQYSVYQQDVERAEKAPASKNDILAKRFGIPMAGYTYFFSFEDTKVHSKRIFSRMSCSMGVDLSRGDDFCAFTFVFPLPTGDFGVKTRVYITEITFNRLPEAMHYKYQQFINEGSLCIINTTILDMMDVYDDLEQFIERKQYDVLCLGYDPYNAFTFITRWETENGPYGVEKVIQGSKTESVPLGELKTMAEERKLLFDEQVMSFSMRNCVVEEDSNRNRKLYKKRYEQKIDPVSAMLDAWVALKIHKDMFE